MQEVTIKDNPLGIKIYVNGMPDIVFVPDEEIGVLTAQMETVISEMYEKNEKRKKYNKNQKTS